MKRVSCLETNVFKRLVKKKQTQFLFKSTLRSYKVIVFRDFPGSTARLLFDANNITHTHAYFQ